MGAPQYEDGEMCWHEDGADVPRWGWMGWIAIMLGVVALAGWLIAGGGR